MKMRMIWTMGLGIDYDVNEAGHGFGRRLRFCGWILVKAFVCRRTERYMTLFDGESATTPLDVRRRALRRNVVLKMSLWVEFCCYRLAFVVRQLSNLNKKEDTANGPIRRSE